MTMNTLVTSIVAGVLALALIIGISAMAIAGVDVPDPFYELLPITVTAALVGAAVAQKAS